MTAFTFKVEVAFDSGFSTLEGSRTWTNVTAYVDAALGCEINYGRADELSTPDPNTLTVAFNNDDGRFTPGKSSSPYYPNVKKGKPIRVTVTYVGVDYVRFTGYINEWPVSWPTGGQERSQVVVTAASRRARLGQTAPLTSAIRAAYLATGPEAYWPMDESTDTADRNGRQAFRDITNPVVRGVPETEFLGAFSATPALAPVVRDGTAGPTDEESLVRFPSSTDLALLDTFNHYVGGGGIFSLPIGTSLTVEAVARIQPTGAYNAGVIWLAGADQTQSIAAWVTGDETGDYLAFEILERDTETFAVLDAQVGIGTPDQSVAAVDGGIHHYLMTLTATNVVTFYFDGVLVGSQTLTAPYVFTRPMTQVAFGVNGYYATSWIGHGAVHSRALNTTEIAAHAAAATAATETPSERVVRIAGRVGVPSGEIDVETSLTTGVGSQPEATRSAADVLDELAISTGGVLYDTRAGHLAMQARNHRYNLASAFTLSATTQEIEGDLTVVDDHRYTKNIIEFSRSGSESLPTTLTNPTSIAAYGDFNPGAYTVVAETDTQAEAFALNLLTRYADPPPRVSTISVDLVDLSNAQRALVLAADIGTRFGISGLPAQAATDPTYLFFEGATESISTNAHTMTINTTPGDQDSPVFILDDATYGVNIETSLVPF